MTATVNERPGGELSLDAIKNLGIKDPEKLVTFLNDFKVAQDEANANLRQEVAEQAAATVVQMMRDNGVKNRVPQGEVKDIVSNRKGRSRSLYNKSAAGVVVDNKAEDVAEFFRMGYHNVSQLRDAEELMAKQAEWRKLQNSFSSTVPDAGGFLVPEEFRSDILANSLENGIVRSRATVIPMSSQRLSFPAVDETSHASGSIYGGVTAYWTEEGGTSTESQAKFGEVTLEPRKLVIYCEAPNELVADAPAFGAFLDRALPGVTGFEEDVAFLMGSGVGQPEGALVGDGVIAESRTASNKIDADDVISVYSRMLPSSVGNAIWLVAPDALPQLLKLTMPTGDAVATSYVAPPLFLANQSLIGPVAGTLLGRPVFITEKTAKLGSAGDLAFVDFSQYLVGDRMAMTLTSSPHYKFQADKTAYKLVERVDGRGWVRSAITPRNGSTNTLSPYVKLAA